MTLLRSIALWFALIVLALILLFALCPRLGTGTFAHITVTKISQPSPGQYSIECSYVASVGSRVTIAAYDGKKFLGGGSAASYGFIGWPEKGTTGLMFTLDPGWGASHTASVPRPNRLFVREGETVTLLAGQWLYFYDFITADGVRHDGYIEVQSAGARR